MTITAAQQIKFEAHVSKLHKTTYPTRTRLWVIQFLAELDITPDTF